MDVKRLPEIKQPTHHEESYDDPRQQRRVNWVVERAVGTVLELGCAEGYILHRVGRPGSVGVDYDRERVEFGREKYSDMKFYVIDVRYGLPFSDRSFDTLLLLEVLEHMELEEAKEVLREAERMARQKVLITLPFQGGPGSDASLVIGPDHKWVPNWETVNDLLQGRSCRGTLADGFVYLELERGRE